MYVCACTHKYMIKNDRVLICRRVSINSTQLKTQSRQARWLVGVSGCMSQESTK